ncbi:hypothetical protein [Arthrobacter crystallopoietes]|uniref:Uncharacterized protein n=1 Tax=Crystallibacter crystallopoietes TaxID=37928 RepID=A0A1H1HUD4_9MICC|nr:hypothetical protein [Arthrobacter crystallopoietes]AUI53762.1 hypothetical protein AC20117_22700 [Arthrobacter crystallopoietes]SDR29072.1 hypothetical protein SAMN04489742_4667 [Arthrobacter crystallopoietes]
MTYLTSRAYYKARILLVPLGPSGASLVSTMSDAGLREILVAAPASHPDGVLLHEIDSPADPSIETVSDLAAATDMMVFLGSRLEEIADDFVEVMATAGRNQGTLLAGVLVGIGGWDSEPGSTSMKVLRRELDMLVTVRKADLARDFIEVLKGGTKDAVPGKLFQLPTPGA